MGTGAAAPIGQRLEMRCGRLPQFYIISKKNHPLSKGRRNKNTVNREFNQLKTKGTNEKDLRNSDPLKGHFQGYCELIRRQFNQ
jgi:hypothetical protein